MSYEKIGNIDDYIARDLTPEEVDDLLRQCPDPLEDFEPTSDPSDAGEETENEINPDDHWIDEDVIVFDPDADDDPDHGAEGSVTADSLASEEPARSAISIGALDEHIEAISQRGVALAVARTLGPTIRWHSDRGCYMLFDHRGWTRDPAGTASLEIVSREAARISMNHIPADAKGATVYRCKMQSSDFARGAWRLLQGLPGVPSKASDWDRDPLLMGLPNGKALCLRTASVRSARPEDMITRQAGCMPDAHVPIGGWLSFVHELASGDEEIIQFLRCWMFLNLSGLTDEQVFVILVGPGGNGKSVFARIMALIAGTYAGTLDAGALCASAVGTRHPTDLAGLAGCRAVNLSEIEPGMKLAESRIKQMTGQDTISARFLHKDFFEYVPTYKLTMTVNDIPRLVSSNKDAIRRRLRCVPCKAKPTQIVKGLAETLFEREGPGILAWILEAREQALEGLPTALAIETETDAAIDAASWTDDPETSREDQRRKKVFDLFVGDVVETLDRSYQQAEIKASALYDTFLEYLDAITEHRDEYDVGARSHHMMDLKAFGLLASGRFAKKRRADGRVYVGIRTRPIESLEIGGPLKSRRAFALLHAEIQDRRRI